MGGAILVCLTKPHPFILSSFIQIGLTSLNDQLHCSIVSNGENIGVCGTLRPLGPYLARNAIILDFRSLNPTNPLEYCTPLAENLYWQLLIHIDSKPWVNHWCILKYTYRLPITIQYSS